MTPDRVAERLWFKMLSIKPSSKSECSDINVANVLLRWCKLKCSIPDASLTALLKNDQLRMAAPSMLDNWKHLVSVAVGVLLINSKAIKGNGSVKASLFLVSFDERCSSAFFWDIFFPVSSDASVILKGQTIKNRRNRR